MLDLKKYKMVQFFSPLGIIESRRIAIFFGNCIPLIEITTNFLSQKVGVDILQVSRVCHTHLF